MISPTVSGRFFDDILSFSRKLLVTRADDDGRSRIHYWTALGLLRGVMSSPAAGIKMLNARLSKLGTAALGDESGETLLTELETADNPVRDTEFGFESDNTPTQVVEHHDWTSYQRQQLRGFAGRLEQLANLEDDQKLASAELILEDWLRQGFNPVVFCRYIATANYVGKQLAPALQEKFPGLDVQVITSELPDELRKQRIDEKGKASLRLLVATDCLSEGINLQQHFTGVLHYDLPWNPNRLEQREGRVDRFGQTAPEVKACLLYGGDNPIDGIVLDVLLRKVREIKRATGISVPFPEDSQSIIDTITQALLINPDRQVKAHRISAQKRQMAFDFGDFDEAAQAKAHVTRMIEEAAEREKISRDIFAQNAIKAQEIEEDLRAIDEAIGDPQAVETFVTDTLQNLLGVQVIVEGKKGHRLVLGNLPPQLRDLLPAGDGRHDSVRVSFYSPTPEGYHYLGRNNRFVEQLCQLVMANTLARTGKRAARAAVIRTRRVTTKTTLLLFRCRNVIERSRPRQQIVAEEMILWGWRGHLIT